MAKKKFRLLAVLLVLLVFLVQAGPLWSIDVEPSPADQPVEDQIPEGVADEEEPKEPVFDNLSPTVTEPVEEVISPTITEEAGVEPIEILVDEEAEAEEELEPEISTKEEIESEKGPVKKSKLTYLWNQVKVFLGVRKASLVKESFGADDKVGIKLRDYKAEELEILVFDSQEEPVAVLIEEDEEGVSIAPAGRFRPGRHKIQVFEEGELILERDFVWGVLAINTNRSVYTPGQTAKLSLAVLDEAGMMVCGAKLELVITNKEEKIEEILSTDNGTIIVNPECFG